MSELMTSWECPECGERISIALDAKTDGANGRTSVRFRIRVPEAALADAFAHAWTHRDTDHDAAVRAAERDRVLAEVRAALDDAMLRGGANRWVASTVRHIGAALASASDTPEETRP